ncbi:MAG: hypothetical protein QOJ19_4648 [Acidimicrobiia bacterium]|nr:hypothetical protein [Acidimicrobiia bacterium]
MAGLGQLEAPFHGLVAQAEPFTEDQRLEREDELVDEVLLEELPVDLLPPEQGTAFPPARAQLGHDVRRGLGREFELVRDSIPRESVGVPGHDHAKQVGLHPGTNVVTIGPIRPGTEDGAVEGRQGSAEVLLIFLRRPPDCPFPAVPGDAAVDRLHGDDGNVHRVRR